MKSNPGHDWSLLRGSNVTYKCKKCGVLGHSPDKYGKINHIQPSIHSPFRGDCELSIINNVMTA